VPLQGNGAAVWSLHLQMTWIQAADDFPLAGFPSSSSIRKTAMGIFGFAVFDYRVFK